jgi:FAD/FMN-containing dehydrogenase
MKEQVVDRPHHPLEGDLLDALGADNVIRDPTALAEIGRDKSPFPDIDPGIVVTPTNVDQVVHVMRIANGSRTPVIVRGGGFSLTGFLQRAPRDSIVIDTRRLNRVLEIDDVNMTVTAETGIIVGDLEDAVADHGFEVRTVGVPVSRTTLGGILSGVIAGGLSRDSTQRGSGRQLIGLKLVLPDGALLQTNAGGSNVHRPASSLHDGDGASLTWMFIGDAGSLGVKVEATLQLTPIATEVDSGQWLFDDFEGVWAALGQLAAIREMPYSGIGVSGEGPPWGLSYESRASSPDLLALQVRRIESVLRVCGGRPDTSDGEAVPSRDWFINVDRAVFAFMFGRAQYLDAFGRIRAMLHERIRERGLSELGIEVRPFIYPYTRHGIYTTISIMYDPSVPTARERTVELATEGYELVVSLGGYLEPQQGVSSRLIAASWSPAYRRLFHGLKSSLDPNRILNPGVWAED